MKSVSRKACSTGVLFRVGADVIHSLSVRCSPALQLLRSPPLHCGPWGAAPAYPHRCAGLAHQRIPTNPGDPP
jgi:hypothetical protein